MLDKILNKISGDKLVNIISVFGIFAIFLSLFLSFLPQYVITSKSPTAFQNSTSYFQTYLIGNIIFLIYLQLALKGRVKANLNNINSKKLFAKMAAFSVVVLPLLVILFFNEYKFRNQDLTTTRPVSTQQTTKHERYSPNISNIRYNIVSRQALTPNRKVYRVIIEKDYSNVDLADFARHYFALESSMSEMTFFFYLPGMPTDSYAHRRCEINEGGCNCEKLL